MPKTKVLKGVVHNIGASFTSSMNYAVDDYVLGHILRFARETGDSTLTIDLLTGMGSPQSLLQVPITGLPERYSQMFSDLVTSSGSDRSLIKSATITLTYDLKRAKPSPIANEPQSPFTCDVLITDIRDRNYTAEFNKWWYVERAPDSKRGLPSSNWLHKLVRGFLNRLRNK